MAQPPKKPDRGVELAECVPKGLHSLGSRQGHFVVDESLLATGGHAAFHFRALALDANLTIHPE